MKRSTTILTLLLLSATIAGCVTSDNDDSESVPALDAAGRPIQTLAAPGGTNVELAVAQGSLSTITPIDGDVLVAFAPDIWVLEDATLRWSGGGVFRVLEGSNVTFLVPPFAEELTFAMTAEGTLTPVDDRDAPTAASSGGLAGYGASQDETFTVAVPYVPGAAFVDGYQVYEWMQHQRDNFPHRTPGMPNYVKAQEYFVELFEEMGYETVVQDEYGMNDAPWPVPGVDRNVQPQSFANVYAYRPGTSGEVLAFGGHYDMVENTKEAAFDDTTGTLQTLALAKAMSQVDTDVGLLFGLWGGEEDGILGSQFFASTHPQIIADMVLYINFDVAAMTWPGPAVDPDPLVISAGPDGPVADALDVQAKHVFGTYVPQLPEELLVYEQIVEGQSGTAPVPQATGSGVNAQSDHTPFMARGVPVYFPFTGNVSTVFALFHSPKDTVHNLTYYMATQEVIGDDGDPEMTQEQFETGRHLLSRSMETYMYFALYQILETDQGLFEPPVKGAVG